MKLFRKSNSTSAIWTSSVATGGGKRGQLPPSLSKTVSEIRPDPLRFIFEGWSIPLDLDLPAAGLLFGFVKHNFFSDGKCKASNSQCYGA